VNKLNIEKILLVDDDEDDCMVFKMALAEVTNEVKFAHRNSCEEIGDAILTYQPDLIFLDINLPRVDGIDCIQQIMKSEPGQRIPVVMYSSSELPKDLQASYLAGASLYFRKPNNITSLINALRDILQMNWHHPDRIKTHHYKDGSYFTYDAGLPA
jgi:CheY-like chemotaxis protein